MRKLVFLFVVVGVTLALTVSAALALNREGSYNDDILRGTDDHDAMYGFPGNDELYGYGGEDYLTGGVGDDYLDAGDDGAVDFIDCGPGNDTVRADPLVDVLHNCEHVVS